MRFSLRIEMPVYVASKHLAIFDGGVPVFSLNPWFVGAGLTRWSQAYTADAEPWFQRAFDIAQDIGARMPQLRAAFRLCRLWQNGDKAELGLRTLRAVYDTFTEGFTTADLKEATQLIGSFRVS